MVLRDHPKNSLCLEDFCMEYFDLIEKRFSVRSFSEQEIEQETLDRILNAIGY